MNDLDLLRQYAAVGSEPAFAQLVERHLTLVYATALRQTRSPELAEEVAQTVFLTLAREAGRLKPDTLLTAWLYRVTRHAAIDRQRGESRRLRREQTAVEMATMKSDPPAWAPLEPLLDEALDELPETDRNALLLRYFENKSLREVGASLGTSEEAARKRVSRAVAELRTVFTRRGITVGSAGLVALLSAQALHAAPAGLTASISATVALSGTAALQHATTVVTTKAIAMNLMQKTLLTATLALAVGTGIYEARQAARLRESAQAWQQQRDSLAEQNSRLQKELDAATERLERLKAESTKPKSDNSELLRLRGEVARLRGEARELAQLKAAGTTPRAETDATDQVVKSWLDRVKKLKDRVGQSAGQTIPEFQFLTDQDWLEAARRPKQLESDADFRQALNSLRSAAKNQFAATVQDALNGYAQANNGQLPADFTQLKPYLAPTVGEEVLQGYEFSQPGTVLEKPKSLVDPDGNYMESVFQIGKDSISSSTTSEDALHQAIQAWQGANAGKLLTDPAQLMPYAQTPAEQAALQKIMKSHGAK